MSDILDQLFNARGLSDLKARHNFLNPKYEDFKHDPFLLPDMLPAVKRIKIARDKKELVYIYGDYDIDGMTATTLLLDAFSNFGIQTGSYIPNRFTEGYGLSADGVEEIAAQGAKLIITVDCGSLSFKEIELANKLGVDVIVTDHHAVDKTMPKAVAVINPKRNDHKYPFNDLAGVGVAFKLVQALQTKIPGLEVGQEKWLLDLVALGTVCDVVPLLDENRANVFWGLQVMQKTRRPGIKALVASSGQTLEKLNSKSLGFILGPRLNATGRLDTAKRGLDLLTSNNPMQALDVAYVLEDMNQTRRADQQRIFEQADQMALEFTDPVLVLHNPNWSHGIIGIVAAKILEKHKKPTFVLQELGETSKGSARSYGDFSAVDAINFAKDHLIKGGGHKLAAGVTLHTKNIGKFRDSLNQFYKQQGLKHEHQVSSLDGIADVSVKDFKDVNEALLDELSRLEPFGHGNPSPTFLLKDVRVDNLKNMGANNQHIKFSAIDRSDNAISVVAFNKSLDIKNGDDVNVVVELYLNEWKGNKTVEARFIGFKKD